ncbi:MAG: hypothetical protein AB2L10_14035 [Methanospirillum sp.]
MLVDLKNPEEFLQLVVQAVQMTIVSMVVSLLQLVTQETLKRLFSFNGD